jgi:hypothetical protein
MNTNSPKAEIQANLASAQLKTLYDDYYPFLIDFLKSNNALERNISFPLLIKPFQEYFESDIKLMIVGQETQSWSMSPNVKSIRNERIDGRVDSLMRLYEDFGLGKDMYSPFWQFCRKLNSKFNSSAKGFLHNNISKVDENGKTPLWDIFHGLSSTSSHSIITKEFEILKPNLVVFTTGKKLENCLRSVFNGIKITVLNETISHVKHPLLPFHSYKTEHPLTLRIRGHFDSVINFISNEVSSGN